MRRDRLLGLALLLSLVQLVAFATLDRRPPDDHDDFYTADCIPWLDALAEARWTEAPGILWDQVGAGVLHPRVAQTALIATLHALETSRAFYRLANLPFLLLLVIGTWLLARELGARRPGLAALAIAATPLVVNASRKWDIQFHAASLTPLGLWLLVAALRRPGRAGAGFWIALGAWQALRLHTHPIVVSDVLLTMTLGGALLIPTARSAGVPPASRLGWWAAAVSLVGWGGLWYSGLAPGLVGAADHNFVGYLQARESYSALWWVEAATPAAWASLGVEMLAETAWVHLFPSGFFLLALGLAFAGARRGRVGSPDRWLLLLPVLLALAQIPPAVLAVSNKAFLNDWLFVLPGLVAVALLGCEAVAGERPRLGTGLVAALALHTSFVLGLPLALAAFGPEPVEEPGWYDRGPLRLFTRSSSGRHLVTHHLISRFEQPGERVAQSLAASAEPSGKARWDLLDLTWDPARDGGPGCQLGPLQDDAGWSWEWPPGLDGIAARDPSAWPFVFEGFDGARLARPDRGDSGDSARWAVVRLWVRPTDRWLDEPDLCRPEARLPEGFLDEARRRSATRLGGTSEVLADPGGWLVGRVIEWDRSRAFTGVGLLIDRSTGEVQVQLEGDLLGHEGASVDPSELFARRLELRR